MSGFITSRADTYPLKASAPKNKVIFPTKCMTRKISRKLPVTAIVSFLPIDELINFINELISRLLYSSAFS
jgi:hypothetical protein